MTTPDEPALSPSEQIEDGIARLRADVTAELLTRLSAQEPVFFEQAVLRPFRDFARNGWPLRGSSGHPGGLILDFVDGR